MEGFLGYLVANPAFPQTAFIDIFDVSPAAIGRIASPIERLIGLLTDMGPPPQRGSALAHDAVIGAVWNIISSYVTNSRLAMLPSLVDVLAFVVLGPYVGPKTAVETIYAAQCRRLDLAVIH
jgi:hypothetical protein